MQYIYLFCVYESKLPDEGLGYASLANKPVPISAVIT